MLLGVCAGSKQDSQLVKVLEQVGDVAVHAKRSGMVELLFAVSAGQDANAEHARSPRPDVVPDRVANDDAIFGARAKPLPARQKEVWLRLSAQGTLSFHHHG